MKIAEHPRTSTALRKRIRHGTSITDRAWRARIRTSYFLHQHVLSNRSSRRSFGGGDVNLHGEQQRVLGALQQDGFATTTFDELLRDDSLWSELRSEMDAFTEKVRSDQEHKSYLVRRTGKKGGSFTLDDPWLRYATSPAVLDVVNSYLQLHSKLVEMDQWYTLPVPPGSDRVASQRWHRDHMDRNIIKVFTYFSDVDQDAGALEYVLGSPPGARHGDLWPWDPIESGYQASEEELARCVPASDRAVATGAAGTIVFCNTTGLHRGGYASKPRISSVFCYVSPASVAALKDRRFTVDLDGARLPDATRFALS